MNGRGGSQIYDSGCKWAELNATIRDKRISILAVQETHLDDSYEKRIAELFPRLRVLNSRHENSTSTAGIAIIVNKDHLEGDSVQGVWDIVPGRAIMTQIRWKENLIGILAVYGPNEKNASTEMWEHITTWCRENSRLASTIGAVLGDFNFVEDDVDRMPARFAGVDDARVEFRELKRLLGVTDGWRHWNPRAVEWTWRRAHRAGQPCTERSRIDRIYVSPLWLEESRDWRTEHALSGTDHYLISVDLTNKLCPTIGKGRWAMPNSVVDDKKFQIELRPLVFRLKAELDEIRSKRDGERNPQRVLEHFKIKAREIGLARAKTMGSAAKKRINELNTSRRRVQHDRDLEEAEKAERLSTLEDEIAEQQKRQARQSNKKLGIIEQLDGEKMTKYFFKKGKSRKPRDAIKSLRIPDQTRPRWETDSRRMAEVARQFYERLQEVDVDIPPDERHTAMQASTNNVKCRLNAEQADRMGQRVSREMVALSMTESKNDSAPGMDGLPYEFWKMLDKRYERHKNDNIPWPDIVGILTEVYNDIEDYGVDESTTFTLGWLCPLWKKGNRDDIANYRPITLLNSVYKIYTKCLAIKLAESITDLIHEDQAGFISGRSIFDQCKLARLMVDWGESCQRNGAIVCLDQEKAYDRIRHDYLLVVLEGYGVPERMRRAIQSLYANAETTVVVNGILSENFRVTRGVRQGDPLSCLLFNLAIEPLAEMIRGSDLQGFRLPLTGRKLITSLFADDTCVYMSEYDDPSVLFRILDAWCKASGAKFNVKKTEIVPVGTPAYRQSLISTRQLGNGSGTFPATAKIAGEGEPVRLLGAYIGNGIDQEGPWTAIVDSIHNSLTTWKKRHLTLSGMSIVIQAIVGGKTQYLSTVQGMPEAVQSEIKKEIQSFIRPEGKKAAIVSELILRKPRSEGGKNILDIEAVALAREMRWIQSFLLPLGDRPRWTELAEVLLRINSATASGGQIPPEARLNPFIQDWRPEMSKLGFDMKRMMVTARKLSVGIKAPLASTEAKLRMPIWLHIGRRPKDKERRTLRASQKDDVAKCLQRLHIIVTTGDAKRAKERWEEHGHSDSAVCDCEECNDCSELGCEHPRKCYNRLKRLLSELTDMWDPKWDDESALVKVDWKEKERLREAKLPGGIDELRAGLRFDPGLPSQKDAYDLVTIMPYQSDITARSERTLGVSGKGVLRRKAGPECPPRTIAVGTAQRSEGSGINTVGGAAAIFPGTDWIPILARLDETWADDESATIIALTAAIRSIDSLTPLKILTRNIVVARCLTSELREMNDGDWEKMGRHREMYRVLVNEMRGWAASIIVVYDDESATKRDAEEEAVRALDDGDLMGPPNMSQQNLMPMGMFLKLCGQSEAYKRIQARAKAPTRKGTTTNMGRARAAIAEISGRWPSEAEIWESIRPGRFGRPVREFMWRTLHNTAKVGAYWLNVAGKEGRSECPQCQMTESLDHILFECEIPGQKEIWSEAEKLWARTGLDWPEPGLGLFLGCGTLNLGNTDNNGEQDEGLSRLFCTIISESCFLIWKLRNERRIALQDDENEFPIPPEIIARWKHCMMKRMELDAMIAKSKRYRKKSIKLVVIRATWEPVLGRGPGGKVPKRWWAEPEFLVSMWPPRPRGRER